VKKTLLFSSAILLLAASAAGLYVANDPASVTALIGGKATKSEPRMVAQAAGDASGASKAKKPQAAAPKETADPQFDRKAAASPAAAESRRPPKREEGSASSSERPVIKVSRKATAMGVVPTNANEAIPPAELYPLSPPIRRTKSQDSQTITVELAVKNASGIQWKTAYISLRSARHPDTVQFQVADWQIDEVIGLDYSFPMSEVQNRMFELRVVGVSGDKRESALAERLQQSRRKYVETNVTEQRSRVTGETLTAVGLLGVMGRVQSPFTGIQIRTADGRRGVSEPVAIVLPAKDKLPQDLSLGLRETSDERKVVVELAEKFHQSALEAQGALDKFTEELAKAPYEEAMKGGAGTALKDLRAKMQSFNTDALALATKVQISQDSDIRKLSDLVPDYSRRILGEIDLIESRIHSVDDDFKVQ